MSRRPWTTGDVRILRERYTLDGAISVAEQLGRTPGAVRAASIRFGVGRVGYGGKPLDLDMIRARCDVDPEDEDACWIWRGAYNRDTPVVRNDGRMVSTRRVAFALANPGTALAGYVCRATCDERGCVRPDHLHRQHRNSLARENGRNGDLNVLARLRLAEASRAQHSPLDWDKVREIRASRGPSNEVGARYGVSGKTIRRIRRREAWVIGDPGMFSGLGA